MKYFVLSFLILLSFFVSAQNPTSLVEDYVSTPCIAAWIIPGNCQGDAGHDFTSAMYNKADGTMELNLKTSTTSSWHSPYYYRLTSTITTNCANEVGQGTVDVSSHPKIRIGAKATAPVKVRVYIQEGNPASWDYAKFSSSYLEMDLTTSFQDFSLNNISYLALNNYGAGTIDLTRIGCVAFELVGQGVQPNVVYPTFDGKVIIDYIQLGDVPDPGCNFLSVDLRDVSAVECVSAKAHATSVVTGGTAPYQVTWNGGTLINDSVIEFTAAGNYMVKVIDGRGCGDSTKVMIFGSEAVTGLDLNTALITSSFRTGFDAAATLAAYNSGCIDTSAQLKLVLDPLAIFQNSSPAPDLISGDTLIWNCAHLNFSSNPFVTDIKFGTSLSAKIGDTIRFITIITTKENDADTSNNIKEYFYPVINAYDPNDIAVYPSGDCEPGYIYNNQKLTYTVRFQNTGNAEAININVLDSLSTNLDISTLKVIGSSHPMYTELFAGNVASFVFKNINLPDSTSDEKGSHGYVVFEINQKAGLSKGTKITNGVGIYFDFNPPVLTNTVLNTISDGSHLPCSIPLSSKQLPNQRSIVYPNPSEGVFTVNSDLELPQIISVYDKAGRELLTIHPQYAATSIDLSNCASDIYLVKVTFQNNVEVYKILIK